MVRIPSHTIADAPEPSRPGLEAVSHTSPTGKPVDLQAQMAHSPAVFVAYMSIRRAINEHGTFDPRHRSAIMVAVAGATQCEYAIAITSVLAARAGWSKRDIDALISGGWSGDDRLDALLEVVREATTKVGHVRDETWLRAVERGWDDRLLAEAFVYLSLILYTALFANYAKTELDIPMGTVRTS